MRATQSTIRTLGMLAGTLLALGASADVVVLSGTGVNDARAHDINDNGLIVGQSSTAFGTFATTWDLMGNRSTLGNASGYDSSIAYGVNNNGQVVGSSQLDTGFQTATLWDVNGVTDLGDDMRAAGISLAWDINDSGLVVGQGAINPGFSKGFVWDRTNGGTVAGSLYQGGGNLGVNNDGVFVGHSFFFGDPDTAMISFPDGRGGYVTEELGPNGFNLSIATAISNTGISVGFTNFGTDGNWEAAIFTTDLMGPPGPPMLLGTLDGLSISEANDVNDAGMVVGRGWDGEGLGRHDRAFAWVNGIMYDLNDSLEIGSEFAFLAEATGVNNNGDIVGLGVLHNGDIAGFVIEGFVPAPGAASILAMGALVTVRRRRSA